MQAVEQQPLLFTEDKIITPLVEVLQEATPKPIDVPPQVNKESTSLRQSLDELFPEQRYEEKDIQKAKEILGSLADEITPEQLKGAIIEMQYLAQTWLDDFEREIFNGLTLKEVLHEKGGA